MPGTALGQYTVHDMLLIEADIDTYEKQHCTEDFDTEFDAIISSISENQQQSVDLPIDLDLENILEGIKCPTVVTTMQYDNNKILNDINRGKYRQFCKIEYSKLTSLVHKLNINTQPEAVSAKMQCEFYGAVHSYMTSAEFRMNCLLFFDEAPFTETHLHICFGISNEIRKHILKKKTELYTIANRNISNRTVTNASQARVRYVGGYCIAKLRHSYKQKKQTSMYKVDEDGQALFEESVCAVNTLDCLKLEEEYVLASTSEPESLMDVSRRQQKNRALTNISDSLFSISF